MALDGMAEPAELAEEAHAAIVDGEHVGAAVEMQVDGVRRLALAFGLVLRPHAVVPRPALRQKMSTLPVPASARAVDEARRIVAAREVEHRVGEELARLRPALVVRIPHYDGRERLEIVHHLLHLLALEPVALHRVGLQGRDRPAVAARKVLNDEDAETIAHRVVLLGLDLDVLAEHVEAAVLQHLHVVFHSLLRRRGKKPIGPPPLVEGADHEVGLVVEEEPEDAIRVLALLDLAHAEVALHHVLAVLRREVVELRAFRRPKGNWRG